MAADGIIDLSLNFDTSDAEHSLSDFSKKIIKTFDKVQINPLEQLDADIEKTQNNIDEIKDKLASIKPIEFEVNTEEVDAKLVPLQQEYDALIAKNNAFSESSYPDYQEWDKVLDRMIEIEDEMAKLESMSKQVVTIPPEEQESFINLNQVLQEQQYNLKALIGARDELINKANQDTEAQNRNIKARKKGFNFKRLLRYVFGIRSLFTLFSKLRAAVKQGIQQVAKYSPTLKKSLDNINGAMNQIRSAVGAAGAAIVVALEPVILRVAQLFTDAANAIGRFFGALLGKKTVVQATANQKAFNKQLKESNKQLASFDDLNVLDNPPEDEAASVAGQFEEVPIEESWLTKVGTWLQENLPLISAVAGALGLIKLLNMPGIMAKIAGYLQTIGPILQQVLGFLLAVYGIVEYINGFIDAWNNGLTSDNLTKMIKGAAIAMVGLFLLLGPTAAAIGGLVMGIGLVVVAFKEWIETGELSQEAITALLIGIGLIIGTLIALHAWIPLIIAGVALLAAIIMSKWEDIKKALGTAWDWIKKHIINPIIQGINWLLERLASGINSIVDMINKLEVNIPEWVPLVGGKGFSPNLKHVTPTKIPFLATGAVLPPNQPFLAMLGDQKQGTNVEAPLDTIVQAMQQALASMNYSGGQEIVLNIDGTALARLTVPNTLNELNRRGYNVKVLEGK